MPEKPPSPVESSAVSAPEHGGDASKQGVAGAFRSAMFWNVANMGVSQIVTTAVYIFLTYRLDPVVFGIFALGVVFIDYFQFQGQSASVDSLLQGQDFRKKTLSSAFWAAMGVVVIATVILFLSGGWMASALSEPTLLYVLPALALTMLPLPFAIAPSALLLREYDFKGVAMRGILAAVLGGGAALVTALSPFPEWALVAQRAVSVTASSVFMMFRARWIPGFEMAWDVANTFLRDTARIFAAQGVAASVMRIVDVIVGVAFGAAAVGLLRIAARFTNALYGAFAAPIGSLWVIFLSKADQSDTDKSFLLVRLTQMSALICLPVFMGVALTAYDLIELALDDDYLAAAPMLVILSLVGLLVPVSYFRNAAFTALKMLNLLLVHSIIDVIVVLVAGLIIISMSTDPAMVILSVAIMHLVRAILTLPTLINKLNTSWRDMLIAMIPAYIACAAMTGAVMLAAPHMTELSALTRLLIKAGLGAAVYFGYLGLFHREWSRVAIDMLKPGNTPKAA